MVISVRRADLVVVIGMDLDLWMNSLIEASKNPRVLRGAKGYLDASANIEKKEVPTGKIDMSLGDIHAQGNPHFLTDPENAKIVVRQIATKLIELDSTHAPYYQKRFENYSALLDQKSKEWALRMSVCVGKKIVTWHPSWIYFAERYGLTVSGTIESKPGISPSPAHLKNLIEMMRREDVKIILIEPYYDVAVAQKIAKATGAQVLLFPQSIGGSSQADNYFNLVEFNVKNLSHFFECPTCQQR